MGFKIKIREIDPKLRSYIGRRFRIPSHDIVILLSLTPAYIREKGSLTMLTVPKEGEPYIADLEDDYVTPEHVEILISTKYWIEIK